MSDSVSVIGEKALFKELAHGLGLFHLSIYGVLFIFHVFFTQHIQHKLGIVYTIILQPIFIFLSACAMFISGSALVGMSGKGVYEVFGGVSKTAYHISFYAFRHNVRGDIKEFLEGYARQAGVLIGSFLILLVYSIVVALEGNLTQIFYFFSGCIAVFSLGKFIFFFRLKKNYTQIAKNNLETPGVIEEKFDAIEIFAQNGHENSIRILSNILHSSHEPLVLKKKILEVLGRRHEPLAIAEILSALSFGNQSLQLSAVKALSKNKYMEKYMKIHVFSRHQLITLLQKSFLHAKSKKLRLAIIQVFKKIQYPEIVLFLLRSLSNKERDIVFCAILACGTFDDISMGSYILPFLNHNDSYIRSAAIITLWPFVRYRSQAIKSLQEMENSKDEDMYMSSIYTKGEILQTSEIPYLEQSLKHETNPHIKKHILLSLIKMKKYEHIPQILQLMFHSDIKISESTKKLIFSPGIDKHLHHNIKYFLHRKIVHEVHKIYKKYPNTSLEELPQTKLRKLHFLYNIIDDELKMMEIEKIIEV